MLSCVSSVPTQVRNWKLALKTPMYGAITDKIEALRKIDSNLVICNFTAASGRKRATRAFVCEDSDLRTHLQQFRAGSEGGASGAAVCLCLCHCVSVCVFSCVCESVSVCVCVSVGVCVTSADICGNVDVVCWGFCLNCFL